MLKKILQLTLVLLLSTGNVRAADISSSDVYAQALRIEQETVELQRQLGFTASSDNLQIIKTELLARHIWAKTYLILSKINLFREQKGLPMVRPVALEPMLNLPPEQNWAQCLRILTEIEILKQALDLKITPPAPLAVVTGKHPVDVFNKLNQISALWNVLIGGQITPPYVYAEAIRLNEDVTQILQARAVMDNTIPPAKVDKATPADALEAAFVVLHEIQRLQGEAGIDSIDLSEFHVTKQVATPQDVFNMIGLVLAELQVIKAKLHLKHSMTPIAQYYAAKNPADVAQVLGYTANRLHQLNLHQEN